MNLPSFAMWVKCVGIGITPRIVVCRRRKILLPNLCSTCWCVLGLRSRDLCPWTVVPIRFSGLKLLFCSMVHFSWVRGKKVEGRRYGEGSMQVDAVRWALLMVILQTGRGGLMHFRAQPFFQSSWKQKEIVIQPPWASYTSCKAWMAQITLMCSL